MQLGDVVITNVGGERKKQVAAWTAKPKTISKHDMDLKRLDNGSSSPSHWKCENCEETDNLWLI